MTSKVKNVFIGVGIVSLVVLVSLLTINYLRYKRASIAPGCLHDQGFFGGCKGTSVILDVSLEPEIPCLKIDPNNCNGGILEMVNGCNKSLKIGGLNLPDKGYSSIELIKDSTGKIIAQSPNGNFSAYTPLEDEKLSIDGFVGDKEFILSYTKTKDLCD